MRVVLPERCPECHTAFVPTRPNQTYCQARCRQAAFHDRAVLEKAKELVRTEGLTYVHPFDDAQLIAGQGTLGLEIVQDWPEVDAVVVPIGGGGLISGVSMAVTRLAFSPQGDPRARSRSLTIVREDKPGDRAIWQLTPFRPPNLLGDIPCLGTPRFAPITTFFAGAAGNVLPCGAYGATGRQVTGKRVMEF